jgi:hypothetical protein
MARVAVVRSSPRESYLPLFVLVAVLAIATAVVVAAAIAVAMVRLLGRHPFCLAAAGATALAMAIGGYAAVIGGWTTVAVGAGAWRRRGVEQFDRRVLGRWRRTFVYGWRWRWAMRSCDLDRIEGWRRRVPRLGAVRSSGKTDLVGVHLLAPQLPTHFMTRSARLAAAFGAQTCRVLDDGAGVVTLELRRETPLLPRPTAIPVEFRQKGSRWTARRAHVPRRSC